MAYDDPVEAARIRMIPGTTGQSFFPAVQRLFDDRSDLLQAADNTFYGGGNAPAPTPTPTPAPRSYFGFQSSNTSQFGLPRTTNFGNLPNAFSTPTPRPTPNPTPYQTSPTSWQDWQARYGFSF
jgi:hypothetical protein